MPGQSRLFLDLCAGALRSFLPLDEIAQAPPPRPAHWPELVHLLAEQNRSSTAEDSLAALSNGAGTVVTGQQVGLFGGPLLFSTSNQPRRSLAPAKATACGSPHHGHLLASEVKIMTSKKSITSPFQPESALEKLHLSPGLPNPPLPAPSAASSSTKRVTPLIERAAELLGPSETTDALVAAYQARPHPRRRPFADFYSPQIFAAQGLAGPRRQPAATSTASAPPSCARPSNAPTSFTRSPHSSATCALEAAGYHAQVAVTRAIQRACS
jgi:bacillithiol synthase